MDQTVAGFLQRNLPDFKDDFSVTLEKGRKGLFLRYSKRRQSKRKSKQLHLRISRHLLLPEKVLWRAAFVVRQPDDTA